MAKLLLICSVLFVMCLRCSEGFIEILIWFVTIRLSEFSLDQEFSAIYQNTWRLFLIKLHHPNGTVFRQLRLNFHNICNQYPRLILTALIYMIVFLDSPK